MKNLFRCFNSSPEVIRLTVMLYIRYPLSLRQVEDILFEWGIDICQETVRFWWNRFGPIFAADIRKRRIQQRSRSNRPDTYLRLPISSKISLASSSRSIHLGHKRTSPKIATMSAFVGEAVVIGRKTDIEDGSRNPHAGLPGGKGSSVGSSRILRVEQDVGEEMESEIGRLTGQRHSNVHVLIL